jgi:hypothetical protein
MLTKDQKIQFREELFRHLDGVVTAPTAYTLHQQNIFQILINKESITLKELCKQLNANAGYLNVALRVLASQGWLTYNVNNTTNTITLEANSATVYAAKHAHLYKDVVTYLQFTENYSLRTLEKEPFALLETIFKKYNNGYTTLSKDKAERNIQLQILKHIEGVLVGPIVVMLGMGGMFHKYFMEASFKPEEYHKKPETFGKVLDFLCTLNWFTKKKDTYSFTEKGLFFAKRASAYGVTVSYIPTLRKLDELIFGNASILRDVPLHSPELHVDREMNVWGSGGAHAAYFKKIDEIVIDIFNQKPIANQPKGILDMGCGNGAFLIHLFDIIEKRTKRGEHLEEFPLFLVGVDYNDTALKVTRANIIQADIWAKIIWGDIGDPAQLNNTLEENYNIQLNNLLNVRTFLDHNRIWTEPNGQVLPTSTSTGAFAHRGMLIDNNKVEQNLKEHFTKWKPYVEKYGLLVIELHTIAPHLTADNIGKTPATAYDATHGFSDQYIVEVDVFKKVAAQAGLFVDENTFSKYPNSELATVSISLLKG